MSAQRPNIGTCDFCSSETELPFQYPAGDFELPDYRYKSAGEWRACATCHDLIDEENWSEIGRRCLADFIRRQPDADVQKSERFIADLHRAFRSHRSDRKGV
jgi:hypothetical protein